MQQQNRNQYQSTELILYGSIKDQEKDQLYNRLKGLCDPTVTTIQEHIMVFKLKTGADSQVQVQMRRRFNGDSVYWHCRYVGLPETVNSPVIVRTVIDSLMYSTNMMEFVKLLGLRMEYEYIADGVLLTKGPIKVAVYKINYTETTGNYSKENRKPLTESHLVEANIMLPDGQAHEQPAKTLREFANQLMPLCELQKIDYMKD